MLLFFLPPTQSSFLQLQEAAARLPPPCQQQGSSPALTKSAALALQLGTGLPGTKDQNKSPRLFLIAPRRFGVQQCFICRSSVLSVLHTQDTHILHAAELQEQRGHGCRLHKSQLLQEERGGRAPVPNTAVRAEQNASAGLRGFKANPSSCPQQHAEPIGDQKLSEKGPRNYPSPLQTQLIISCRVP